MSILIWILSINKLAERIHRQLLRSVKSSYDYWVLKDLVDEMAIQDWKTNLTMDDLNEQARIGIVPRTTSTYRLFGKTSI